MSRRPRPNRPEWFPYHPNLDRWECCGGPGLSPQVVQACNGLGGHMMGRSASDREAALAVGICGTSGTSGIGRTGHFGAR